MKLSIGEIVHMWNRPQVELSTGGIVHMWNFQGGIANRWNFPYVELSTGSIVHKWNFPGGTFPVGIPLQNSGQRPLKDARECSAL